MRLFPVCSMITKMKGLYQVTPETVPSGSHDRDFGSNQDVNIGSRSHPDTL